VTTAPRVCESGLALICECHMTMRGRLSDANGERRPPQLNGQFQQKSVLQGEDNVY